MIKQTITDNRYFGDWLHRLDEDSSYKDYFSFEAADALQAYLEELSEDMGEDIEFEPVAWCIEFSEYKGIDDYNEQNGTSYALGIDDTDRPDITDETTVIEFDGGILVQEF